MDTLSIAPHFKLEYDTQIWRLYQEQDYWLGPALLAEASPERVRLSPALNGHETALEIPTPEIGRIEYTPTETGWRVGLRLLDERWLTLIAMPDEESAHHVAAALGAVLGRVFQNPSAVTAPQPAITRPPLDHIPPVTLHPLPLDMGKWLLRVSPLGLVWQQSGRAVMNQTARVVSSTLILVIFLVLAVGSQTAGLAAVEPEWLPYVALGIAALLAVNVAETLWKLGTPRQVVLDEKNREIRQQQAMTGIVDWRVPFDSVDYVLVSQERARSQGRRSTRDPMHIAQDMWLHVRVQDTFYLIAELGTVEGTSLIWESIRGREAEHARHVLDLREYNTLVHHAALHLAGRLGVPAYVDIR